jgi:hypothetical protein
MTRGNGKAKTVKSSSGNSSGKMYWSDFDKGWMFVYYSREERKRKKKRLSRESDAIAVLDTDEKFASISVKDPGRYLTVDEQQDALTAITILGGAMSLTKAAKMAVERERKALHQAVDDEAPLDYVVEKFLERKLAEGRSPATILTYRSRLKPLLVKYAKKPINRLTQEDITGVCDNLSKSSVYGLLTAAGSLENFIYEANAASQCKFSIDNIRFAARELSNETKKKED